MGWKRDCNVMGMEWGWGQSMGRNGDAETTLGMGRDENHNFYRGIL